jgi:hypothetical protein
MPLLALLAVLAGAPLTEPVPGPAPNNQLSARVVSNGSDYLAVWTDRRSLPAATYATRVTADGRVLDGTGIHLTDEPMYTPAMVWAGDSYVIAWTADQDVWLLRIDRDGAIVDGPRVVVEDAHHATAAFDGTHVVLGYYQYASGFFFEPHALFLTRDAVAVKDVTLAGRGDYGPPMIAWNGSHFAAAWLTVTNNNTVLHVDGVRFTVDGPIGPVTRLLDDPKQYNPRLVSDGRDFLLLTYDDNVFRHFARHVSADLGTVGEAVMLPAELRGSAMALWMGDHYVATGDSGSQISAVRLDREGRLASEVRTIREILFSGSEPGSFAATNGRDLLVTWSGVQHSATENAEPFDIYGATVSGSTLGHEATALLSIAAPRQTEPAVASSGASHLTAWIEKTGLYARRSDTQPIRIADRADRVRVTFDGTGYIVAWTELNARLQYELVTRRLSATGPLTASGGTRVAFPISTPLALASDGRVTLLAWASPAGVQAVRLTKAATFADTIPLTLTADGTISALSAAANGRNEFLVAWGNTFFTEHGGMNPVNVLAARVTGNFTNLDPDGFEVAATPAGEGHPSVAWNGSEWIVVWQRGNEVRGRLVARNGALLGDDTLIVAGAKLPAIAWNGTYTLAWTGMAAAYSEPEPLRVARFAQLGDPLASVATLGEVEAFGRQSASLALANGGVAVAYARIAREPEAGGVMRAFLSTLSAPRRRAARH